MGQEIDIRYRGRETCRLEEKLVAWPILLLPEADFEAHRLRQG